MERHGLHDSIKLFVFCLQQYVNSLHCFSFILLYFHLAGCYPTLSNLGRDSDGQIHIYIYIILYNI